MIDKTFSVTLLLSVDARNSVLSSYVDSHEEDVRDLVSDMFYDLDDVHVRNILVRER